MYTIEFVTSIKNGIVHIPIQYKELQQKESAKIVIIVEDLETKSSNVDTQNNEMEKSVDFFDKFQIDMTDYKFDREEANER